MATYNYLIVVNVILFGILKVFRRTYYIILFYIILYYYIILQYNNYLGKIVNFRLTILS